MSVDHAPRTAARTGTALLVRLAARRDRVMVPVWIAVLVLVCYASAASTTTLYTSEADRVSAAEAINASPGIVALYGPILDVHSTGELAMTKMTVTYAVFVAIMMLFVVRRHTRMDEENGQAELLGGTAITPGAPLTAAIVFGLGVALLLGVLVALVNLLGGLPATGSLAFGAAWAGTAMVATGLTAVACQVSASSRTCAAVGAAAIGALFVLRAVGDTTDASWLGWVPPFGWNTRLRAYGDTRWWVLLLYGALTALLVATAQLLRRRRDLGSGITQPRPGPATGSPRLADVIALTLRVHAPMLVGWTCAVAVMGLVFGAISPSFDAFDSAGIRDMLERIGGAGAFRDTLLSAVVSVTAIVVTCFGIAVVGHAGNDEHDGRTEEVLATATSRSRAFLASGIVALGGATWLLLTTGVALALGVGNDTDHSFATMVASPLAQAPAVWVVVGCSLALFAWRSQWAVLGWGVLVLFVTIGQIGELLDLPTWVLDVSPYTHAPAMPLESFTPGAALVLTGIAAALSAAAWLEYASRDIG
jgi:ABC-2 type transport system permease protein